MPGVEAIFAVTSGPVPQSGTEDDSPPLQRWVGEAREPSPTGTAEKAGPSTRTEVLARDDKREKRRFFVRIGVLRLRTSKRSSCCAQDDKSAKGSAPPLRMTNEVGSSFSEGRIAKGEKRIARLTEG